MNTLLIVINVKEHMFNYESKKKKPFLKHQTKDIGFFTFSLKTKYSTSNRTWMRAEVRGSNLLRKYISNKKINIDCGYDVFSSNVEHMIDLKTGVDYRIKPYSKLNSKQLKKFSVRESL